MKPDQLTNKDLSNRWGCDIRTVRRRVRQFGLKPVDYTGWMPVYDPSSVEKMETKRRAHIARQLREHGRKAA